MYILVLDSGPLLCKVRILPTTFSISPRLLNFYHTTLQNECNCRMHVFSLLSVDRHKDPCSIAYGRGMEGKWAELGIADPGMGWDGVRLW